MYQYYSLRYLGPVQGGSTLGARSFPWAVTGSARVSYCRFSESLSDPETSQCTRKTSGTPGHGGSTGGARLLLFETKTETRRAGTFRFVKRAFERPRAPPPPPQPHLPPTNLIGLDP